jgi:hypothetical protein
MRRRGTYDLWPRPPTPAPAASSPARPQDRWGQMIEVDLEPESFITAAQSAAINGQFYGSAQSYNAAQGPHQQHGVWCGCWGCLQQYMNKRGT